MRYASNLKDQSLTHQITVSCSLCRRHRRATARGNGTTQALVLGLRVEESDKHMELDPDGVPNLLAGSDLVIRLFGEHIPDKLFVAFTPRENNCELLVGEVDKEVGQRAAASARQLRNSDFAVLGCKV